ncbi:frequenin-1-like isoform X2, partial [Dinothrombium tinctorium]
DGVITFDEFINAVSIPTRGTIDEKLDWAFSVYDSDDDGYITKEEMLNIVRAVYERKGLPLEKCNVAQKKVETIFHQMDSVSILPKMRFLCLFSSDFIFALLKS